MFHSASMPRRLLHHGFVRVFPRIAERSSSAARCSSQSGTQVSLTPRQPHGLVLVNGYATSSAAEDQASTTLFNAMQRLYCSAP
jgi:hypothetical protein